MVYENEEFNLLQAALNIESVYCESKLVGCQIRGGVISGVS
mgnify:CR=1 FL=1